MKRIKDGYKIITGQLPVNTVDNRIHLFDGKYTTGFKLVGFRICSESPLAQHAFMATVYTEKGAVTDGSKDTWQWDDVRQIAWGLWTQPYAVAATNKEMQNYREDNLIVEDIFIANYGNADNTFVNYEIILQKYDITAWDAASVMVRNQSQAGSS